MKDSQNKEEEEKKSRFQKFKEYMASLEDRAKETAVGKGFAKFSQTKAYKVLTGKAFARAITLGTIAIAAIGLITVAPAALGVMAAGLVAAIAVDTYMTYKTKTLYKEAKMLRDNKASFEKQKGILEKTPGLSKALGRMLFDPSLQKGKSKEEISQKKETSTLNAIGGAIVSAFESAGGIVNAVITGNPVSGVVALAGAVTGIAGGTNEKYSLSETRANLREFIEHEKKKDYSPGYNDKKSLKEAVDKQRIQTLALEKLSVELEQKAMINEQIQTRFVAISEELAVKANKVAERNPIMKFGRRVFKNMIRAHDPFSKYNDATKLYENIIPKNSAIGKELKQKKEHKKHHPHELKKMAEPVKKSLENSKETRGVSKTAPIKKKNKHVRSRHD